MLTTDQHGSLGAWRGSTPAFPVYNKKMNINFYPRKQEASPVFRFSSFKKIYITVSWLFTIPVETKKQEE